MERIKGRTEKEKRKDTGEEKKERTEREEGGEGGKKRVEKRRMTDIRGKRERR